MKILNRLQKVFDNISKQDKQTARQSIDIQPQWFENPMCNQTIAFTQMKNPIKLKYGQDFTTYISTLDYTVVRTFEHKKHGTVVFNVGGIDGITMFNFWSEKSNQQDLVGLWIDQKDFNTLEETWNV